MAGNICSVRPPRCAAILAYCSVRDSTRFLPHRIKNIRIHPSTCYRIRCGLFFPLWPCPQVIRFVADIFFSTLESGFISVRIRCRIRQIHVVGSRIWKEKVADSKISGYVWRGLRKVFLSNKDVLIPPKWNYFSFTQIKKNICSGRLFKIRHCARVKTEMQRRFVVNSARYKCLAHLFTMIS